MSRRAPFTGLLLGSIVVLGGACSSAYSEDGSPSQEGDGGSTEDGRAEAGLATFACGTTVCIVGAQACCSFGGAVACVAAESGCHVADGGADADEGGASGVRLDCTSEKECGSTKDCCYSPETGSTCADACKRGDEKLCKLGSDKCSPGETCGVMPSPPAPGVGRCMGDD